MASADTIRHLFVYGTLQPGEPRWHHLEPFVVDEGSPDSVPGRIFDTGEGYPAAMFGDLVAPGGTIVGRTYELHAATMAACLEELDDVEGVVWGEYRRISTTTHRGIDVWTYEFGLDAALTEIPSGNWFDRLP